MINLCTHTKNMRAIVKPLLGPGQLRIQVENGTCSIDLIHRFHIQLAWHCHWINWEWEESGSSALCFYGLRSVSTLVRHSTIHRLLHTVCRFSSFHKPKISIKFIGTSSAWADLMPLPLMACNWNSQCGGGSGDGVCSVLTMCNRETE